MIPLAVRVADGDGRYFVTSRSLFCQNPAGCSFSYQQAPGRQKPKHKQHDLCPRCGTAKLAFIEYLCDLNLFGMNGRCGCRRWECFIQPKVAALTPEEWQIARFRNDYRCPHLEAALMYHALLKLAEVAQERRSTQEEDEGGRA